MLVIVSRFLMEPACLVSLLPLHPEVSQLGQGICTQVPLCLSTVTCCAQADGQLRETLGTPGFLLAPNGDVCSPSL